mgnify:CR=1 FL=1
MLGPPLWSPIDTAFLGLSPLYRLYMPTPDRYLKYMLLRYGLPGHMYLVGSLKQCCHKLFDYSNS